MNWKANGEKYVWSEINGQKIYKGSNADVGLDVNKWSDGMSW